MASSGLGLAFCCTRPALAIHSREVPRRTATGKNAIAIPVLERKELQWKIACRLPYEAGD
jgi:hypothetical protein